MTYDKVAMWVCTLYPRCVDVEMTMALKFRLIDLLNTNFAYTSGFARYASKIS